MTLKYSHRAARLAAKDLKAQGYIEENTLERGMHYITLDHPDGRRVTIAAPYMNGISDIALKDRKYTITTSF